ncbi:MAG: hypothetical protein ABR608_09665 [Pseudonocardiaceae bacterium]
MTCTTTACHHLDDFSLMSDQEYVAYQRGLEDELIDLYYSHGLSPPWVTPMPTVLAELEPPF